MRNLKQTTFAVLLLPLMACGGGAQQQAPACTGQLEKSGSRNNHDTSQRSPV